MLGAAVQGLGGMGSSPGPLLRHDCQFQPIMHSQCVCLRQALLWHWPKQQVSRSLHRPAAALATTAEGKVSAGCNGNAAMPQWLHASVGSTAPAGRWGAGPWAPPVGRSARKPWHAHLPPPIRCALIAPSRHPCLRHAAASPSIASASLLRANPAGWERCRLVVAAASRRGPACSQDAEAAARGRCGAVRWAGLHSGGRAGSRRQGRGRSGGYGSAGAGA